MKDKTLWFDQFLLDGKQKVDKEKLNKRLKKIATE